jgi:hypothetical protein
MASSSMQLWDLPTYILLPKILQPKTYSDDPMGWPTERFDYYDELLVYILATK